MHRRTISQPMALTRRRSRIAGYDRVMSRPRRRAVGVAVGISAACWLVFLALALIAATNPSPSIDHSVLAWIDDHRTSAMTAAMKLVTWLGSAALLYPATLVGGRLLAPPRSRLARGGDAGDVPGWIDRPLQHLQADHRAAPATRAGRTRDIRTLVLPVRARHAVHGLRRDAHRPHLLQAPARPGSRSSPARACWPWARRGSISARTGSRTSSAATRWAPRGPRWWSLSA